MGGAGFLGVRSLIADMQNAKDQGDAKAYTEDCYNSKAYVEEAPASFDVIITHVGQNFYVALYTELSLGYKYTYFCRLSAIR
ncbi:MAG: hypothetical protein H6765_02735 [Candidatus Peribacteria bacterium]|nr:MAG: hypothetical protein H6765_02735 [Candidatus Peribacteria bacterium]